MLFQIVCQHQLVKQALREPATTGRLKIALLNWLHSVPCLYCFWCVRSLALVTVVHLPPRSNVAAYSHLVAFHCLFSLVIPVSVVSWRGLCLQCTHWKGWFMPSAGQSCSPRWSTTTYNFASQSFWNFEATFSQITCDNTRHSPKMRKHGCG